MWHAKSVGAYSRDSPEAKENANEITALLLSLGWTLNAISAVLGNMGAESGYNPWRWEGDNVLASTDTDTIANSTKHGYGLVQYTPSGKYILSSAAKELVGYSPNFSDISGTPEDGAAQVMFFNLYADYYPTSTYPMTYEEFKHSALTPSELAVVWLYNYERPADPESTANSRSENAEYWYTSIGGVSTPKNKKHIKIWQMSQAYYRGRFLI